MTVAANKLNSIEKIIDLSFDDSGMQKIMEMLGAGQYSALELSEFKLYSDYLPKSKTDPHSKQQRFLQILWETIDRVPLGINSDFAIPFRQILAQNMFKKCGKGFIAYQNILLNFPHLIEVGDYVAWNCGCILDSKGGISFGSHSMLAENVTIFTHSHGEDDHVRRTYSPVKIGEHVILGSHSTIMPGVTMEDGSFAGVGSVVTKDVDKNMVVAGTPAKPIRQAHRQGKSLEECNHYFLDNHAFQD